MKRTRRSRPAPNPLENEAPPPVRPRFHFSLGTLMFVMLAACVGAAGIAHLLRAEEQTGLSRLTFVVFPLVAPAVFLLLAVAWQSFRNWRN